MNRITGFLATFSRLLQGQLFPVLTEELGPLGERHQAFVRALSLLQLDGLVSRRRGRGRPAHDRACVARAFLAKAVFNLPHTRSLLERLAHDPTLRRLCGWERAAEVPEESVFSRAFSEFARDEFAQRVHAALIQRTQSERLVGHILRDGSAIEAREKAAPKPAQAKDPRPRRLHRKAGTAKRPEQMTRIERQASGAMTLAEMMAELPRACNVGCKPNSKGVREYWTGYKLHMDVADGQIPISLRIDLGFAQRQPGGHSAGAADGTAGDELLRPDGYRIRLRSHPQPQPGARPRAHHSLPETRHGGAGIGAA
jgi:hypothetical protein